MAVTDESTRPPSDAVRWFQGQVKTKIPDGIARCVEVMSSVRPPHNWWPVGGWGSARADFSREGGVGNSSWYQESQVATHAVYACHHFLELFVDHQMSTYDGDELTRLVIAAHQNRVRVAISTGAVLVKSEGYYDGRVPVVHHCLHIQLDPREATEAWHEWHPGTDRLVERMTSRESFSSPGQTH